MNRGLKFGLLALAALLAGGIIAPYVRVNQYREQIRAGLERSLHRKVQINGETHLNLFRGPGFSVEQVLIEDDPSAGIEPLASVAEMQTTVSLRSLWTGRLEFASVRFVEPHLNLVKPEVGEWNVMGLLAGAATQASGSRLPAIHVSGGRVNFKFGNVKSSVYLTETDLTIAPAGGGLDLRFSCAPARTDRTEQGYGTFSGRGRIVNGQLNIETQLEKSPVEDLVTLVRGQSLGLHGLIASRATVAGSLLKPEIRGRFELEDVHRWDLIGGRGATWSMAYRGTLETTTQRLEIVADQQQNPGAPLTLNLHVDQALSEPRWLVEAGMDQLPASGLIEFARHMGAPLPSGIVTDGTVAGTVRYGEREGLQGELKIRQAAIKLDRGAQFALPEASLMIEGDEARLLPAEVLGSGNQAQFELRYAPFRQHLEARLSGKGLKIADLQEGAGHLLDGAGLPAFERLKGGTWSGAVHYLSNGEEPGEWSASLQVRDTTTTVPGVAAPVRFLNADLDISGERLTVRRIRALAGELPFYGEYRYDPQSQRAHRFSLIVPEADAAELETLLMPSLHRTSEGFLARTLRWRPSLPEWLRDRRATGSLRIGTLTFGETRLRGIRSQVVWNGAVVQLPDLEARIDEGSLEASVTANLTRPEPEYRIRGTVQKLPWKSGKVDLDGIIDTAGTGADMLANLRADGTFDAVSVAITPDLALRTLSGSFDVGGSRLGPQVRLSSVQASTATERFNGEGATQPDGRLLIELASASRSMRVSGPIASLRMEVELLK